MKRGKTVKQSSNISESQAIIMVAAYTLAFMLGAVVPFIAHADQNHGQDNQQNSHSNHDNNGGDNNGHDGNNDNSGHNDGDHNNDGHGDNGHGNDGDQNGNGDNNGHDGHGNNGHDGHDGDNNGDNGGDNGGGDTTGGDTTPSTGGIAVIKNTIGGDGTFSFGGSNSFTITTIDGVGEQDFFNVTPGSYTLSETIADGWTQTSNSCTDGINVIAGATTTCTVVNTKDAETPPTDNGGGDAGGDVTPPPAPEPTPPPSPEPPPSGNGPIAGSLGGGTGGGSIFGGGLVLGASTTAPTSCAPLIHDYMRIGKHNDPEQVKLLQLFLNQELGINVTVDGIFGESTDAAVREFQKMHESEILSPWGINYATGYVYKTTLRWINLTQCSSLVIPMPELH